MACFVPIGTPRIFINFQVSPQTSLAWFLFWWLLFWWKCWWLFFVVLKYKSLFWLSIFELKPQTIFRNNGTIIEPFCLDIYWTLFTFPLNNNLSVTLTFFLNQLITYQIHTFSTLWLLSLGSILIQWENVKTEYLEIQRLL